MENCRAAIFGSELIYIEIKKNFLDNNILKIYPTKRAFKFFSIKDIKL